MWSYLPMFKFYLGYQLSCARSYFEKIRGWVDVGNKRFKYIKKISYFVLWIYDILAPLGPYIKECDIIYSHSYFTSGIKLSH